MSQVLRFVVLLVPVLLALMATLFIVEGTTAGGDDWQVPGITIETLAATPVRAFNGVIASAVSANDNWVADGDRVARRFAGNHLGRLLRETAASVRRHGQSAEFPEVIFQFLIPQQ